MHVVYNLASISRFVHGIRDIVQDNEESIRNQQELASTAANQPSPQESCCGPGHDDSNRPVQLAY